MFLADKLNPHFVPKHKKLSGPAHRGANGAVMPTDEDDQDGLFFINHPERGGYSAA